MRLQTRLYTHEPPVDATVLSRRVPTQTAPEFAFAAATAQEDT